MYVGVVGQGKFYDHRTGSTQDVLLQHFSYHKYFIHLKSEFRQVIETLKRYAFKEIIKLVKRSKIRNLASMVEDWFVENVLNLFFYRSSEANYWSATYRRFSFCLFHDEALDHILTWRACLM